MLRVIDENVLVVANDLTRASSGVAVRCPEADDDCRLACVDVLVDVMANGRIILDEGSEYFDKYRSHGSLGGQPGVGDAFVKAVFEQGYSDWAVRVVIRNGEHYLIPESVKASGFDNDDYLWIAGAHNAPNQATIINAVDSDYTEWFAVLAEAGINVSEICATC